MDRTYGSLKIQSAPALYGGGLLLLTLSSLQWGWGWLFWFTFILMIEFNKPLNLVIKHRRIFHIFTIFLSGFLIVGGQYIASINPHWELIVKLSTPILALFLAYTIHHQTTVVDLKKYGWIRVVK